MRSSSLPKRFLSRRDKSGHRRGKSSDAIPRHRSITADALFSIFKSDGAKQHAKEDHDAVQVEREEKIGEVRLRAASQGLDLRDLDDRHILYTLGLKYASMDVDRAIEILELQQASISGEIFRYNPAIRMLGAENRGNVTCYLDALLFAMFAKLDAFECMLKVDHKEDDPRRKLAILLRLWVNMLRSGKLIETDMTEHIQEALAECGWLEAQYLEQQDTSEAFAFITETLQLPLLQLQVDLFHNGKNDDADHKVVYERLLNLAVPPDSEGKGIKLEDCLEEYFNSQVDVLREGTDEKKASDSFDQFPTPISPKRSYTAKQTIRVVEVEEDQADNSPDAFRSPQFPAGEQQNSLVPDVRISGASPNPESPSSPSTSPINLRPQRSRTDSIIQRVVLDGHRHTSEKDTAGLFPRAKQKASVVKAVTIPAWQFFKLIPWHTAENSDPQSDLEVAQHFSQRPVVGICLKRYMMDKNGVMQRQNTYIDIPDSLRLPHFIINEKHLEQGGLAAEYKLVLQSVVCHRGDSLHSGHYVSFSRVAPKLLTHNRIHEKDPPPDYEEAQWVKFDDLASERVTAIDNIKESLKDEMPYLLFYQIVPIVCVAPSEAGSTEADPPAYNEGATPPTISDYPGRQEYRMVSQKNSTYFDNTSSTPSAAPSVRFSTELERPQRYSLADEDGFLNVSRRGSSSYGDMMASGSSTASNEQSPGVKSGEETTAQRLSRAAAIFKSSSKSRPHSQAGETRISQTMSRLGLLKPSKEPLRDPVRVSQDSDTDNVIVNGESNEQGDEDLTPRPYHDEKEKELTHKRGKSKTRFDRGRSKEKDVPDRECIVQ